MIDNEQTGKCRTSFLALRFPFFIVDGTGGWGGPAPGALSSLVHLFTLLTRGVDRSFITPTTCGAIGNQIVTYVCHTYMVDPRSAEYPCSEGKELVGCFLYFAARELFS